MSRLSNFTKAAVLMAAPLFYTGCSQEDDPTPAKQDVELNGTATKVILFSPSAKDLYSVEIEFKATDGKAYSLLLARSSRTDGADFEAQAGVTTDNFLTEKSVAVNMADQRIETRQNSEYRVTVNVNEGKEETAGGFKKANIRVPFDAISVVEYNFGNESKVKELSQSREKLNEAVQYLLGNIENNPANSGSGKMPFASDLKLQ